MIPIDDLRENPEKYREAIKRKGVNVDLDYVLELDRKRRTLLKEVEQLKSKQNAFSKEIKKLEPRERDEGLVKMKQFSSRIKSLSQELEDVSIKWSDILQMIPLPPFPDVPDGESDKDNVEIRRIGAVPEFGFEPKDHVQLGKMHNLFDIERGVKIAGSRNYLLTGDGAKLHHAVLNFAMDFISKRGFTLVDPPHIVKEDVMYGTGFFPGGEEQAYGLDERDKARFLIGTSEVPLCAIYKDEILNHEDLPIRLAGYSPCYRREAGTYGKDTKGLFRVHQFYKVEQVVICEASEEESRRWHRELMKNSEEFMQALGLPYRVVRVCTADLAIQQAYKEDIEAWMPSRSAFSETHSCSICLDFQSRRLKTRYKLPDGKNVYCHTLNNTLAASPRLLIPLLEIHQNSDGSITVPKALQPYFGKEKIG